MARRILSDYRRWAVVGWSPSPARDSNRIASFLEDRGYDVIRVNPNACGDEPLCVPDLHSLPEPVEVVDIFRRSDAAGAHVDEAAADRARAAGLDVVMDRCPAIDHPRLIGAAS